MRPTRVLISDGETAAGLAVTRSLAREGHRVGVLASTPHAAAAASRHAGGVFRVPDPMREPEAFAEALLGLVRRGPFAVFLPLTDTALLIAAGVREDLLRHCIAAVPAPDALDRLLDKRAVLDAAADLGIPVLSSQRADPDDAPLPAVVKPGRSRVLRYRGTAAATAKIVGDREALRAESEALDRAGFSSYVEPWVPGEGRGIFLLRHEGEILARFAHRRVREASPLGGPSAVCESIAADPELLDQAERLAAALEIDGPFMAEFRGGPGEWVLLEVNARYWGSLPLAIDAGVDFPALHVRALLGDPVPGPTSWETGLRRRHLAFDLRYAARVARGAPAGLADLPWPGRISSWWRVLTERARGMFRSADDPAPARSLLLHLLRKALFR